MQSTVTKSTGKLTKTQKPGWKKQFWHLLGFNNQPVIRLYLGYGHAEKMVIYGHALSLSPLPRIKFSNSFILNLLALIRLFLIKPIGEATVQLVWQGKTITAQTDKDGFIKLNWKSDTPVDFGWHKVSVDLLDAENQIVTSSYGSVLIPHSTQFAFVSDIDDTFLVSHSANIRKRLSVLFTRNARTRKAFEGVVKHYQMLAHAHTKKEEPNPFFYVSSSEWNLYEYILEFKGINGLPRGALILSHIKQISNLLFTGQTDHGTKFDRIVRIMEAFPKQKFILLGDSSQEDPVIYSAIVTHFPGRIHAVYIRDIYKKNVTNVQYILQKIEETGIPCCFFTHSAEAIAHSKQIGLIN